METATLVVQRLTGFGKADAPDSRGSANFVSLALDVHDATFHGLDPKEVYVLERCCAKDAGAPPSVLYRGFLTLAGFHLD